MATTAAATQLAYDENISLEDVEGTGKNGKIVTEDVQKVVDAAKKKKKEMPHYSGVIPELVTKLAELSLKIRTKFPFGGKENHFQNAMEVELRNAAHMVQHEVCALLHYETLEGEDIRLAHDIRSREDLLLPREKMILELKAVPGLKDKDHCQLLRYMEERRKSSWGEDTCGMLINYGDNVMEIWYMFYKNGRAQRVNILQKELPAFTEFVDSFVYP
jgi:GxxExxY protein